MTGHSSVDTTIVICPIAAGTPASEAAAWIGEVRRGDVPVTWIIPVEQLAAIRDAGGHSFADSPPPIAVDLSTDRPVSRHSLRQALRKARHAWPEVEAASILGDAVLDHRDVLVQEGITTVAVDRFDAPGRGTRRPAPRGWPCRSLLWGLWEVAIAATPQGFLSQVTGWCRSRERGRLVVWHAGRASAAMLRPRLERHLARLRRQAAAGKAHAIALTGLPGMIAGGDPAAERGSVLRAA
jgi:hypothetical protein